MGKKQKRRLRNHEQHHAAIHRYIVMKKIQDGEVEGHFEPEHHVVPMHQPWHVSDTSCPCFPKRIGIPDAQTGVSVWLHSGWIH